LLVPFPARHHQRCAGPGSGNADAEYLNNKTIVAVRSGLTAGPNDFAHAKAVMAGMTSSSATVSTATSLVDSFAASAATGTSSELVMQIVGIAV
jgi:hypothetical protein